MAIKCILVDIDNVLISEVEQIMSEVGDPDCKLINPYRFYDIDNMTPWVKASNQSYFMLRSSDILTIVDPTEEVIERYKELTE